MSVTSARVNLAARRGIVAIAFAALLAAAGPGTALGAHGEAEAKRAPTAQLVLIHGTILTVDAADSARAKKSCDSPVPTRAAST
jgi:hypothetical protein